MIISFIFRRAFLFACTMFILTVLMFWIHIRMGNIELNKIVPDYINYIQSLFSGEFGYSKETEMPVVEEMKIFFPSTLELVFLSFSLAFVFGLIIGMLSGLNHHTFFDSLVRIFCQIAKAIPVFWLGQIFIIVLAIKYKVFPSMSNVSLTIDVQPITNSIFIDAILTKNSTIIIDMLKHLCLPLITITIVPLAVITSIVRSKTIILARSNFIKAAQCKGAGTISIAYHQVTRNILPEILPYLSIIICNIFSTTILVEIVFEWPGIGLWLLQSISSEDHIVIEASTFVLATALLILNLSTSIICAIFFPSKANNSVSI